MTSTKTQTDRTKNIPFWTLLEQERGNNGGHLVAGCQTQDGGLELLKLFGIDRNGRGSKEAGILVILLELRGVAGPLDPGHKRCRYLN
jgi:hypothetical protein